MELDIEWCAEIVEELIEEQGQEVFKLEWDSGGPGGAGVEAIYRFHDLYWPRDSDQGFSGDSLLKPLRTAMQVTGATRRVACIEMSATQLARALNFSRLPTGHVLIVNNETWRMSVSGKLEAADGETGLPTGRFRRWSWPS